MSGSEEKSDIFRYFETGSTDPYYNLACEEVLFDHITDGDILMLWQNSNTVVIGRNQITEQQINAPFVEAHKIRVVRRMTGGGAVYHDLGNLNYSFITDERNGSVQETLERLTAPVVRALRALGLRAQLSGRNDILIDGRKVSGTAQRSAKGRILHHGTLLFSSDAGMIEGALRVDPEKFRGKGIRSVPQRVGNIREMLDALPDDGARKRITDVGAFREYLKRALTPDGTSLIPGRLTGEQLQAAAHLAESKYRTREWNYGQSPRFEVSARRYLAGGLIECFVNVRSGRIAEAEFYGDFLAERPLDEPVRALAGCLYERRAVAAALAPYAPGPWFGAISAEEIADVLFADETDGGAAEAERTKRA